MNIAYMIISLLLILLGAVISLLSNDVVSDWIGSLVFLIGAIEFIYYYKQYKLDRK